MFEFKDSLWSSDARTSLETLLKIDIGKKAFLAFLKSEYGRIEIDDYLEYQRIESLRSSSDRALAAGTLYVRIMGTDCTKISKKEMNEAPNDVWEKVDAGEFKTIEDAVVMSRIREEAELTLGILSFDAFPRFIKSRFCDQALSSILESDDQSEVGAMINEMVERAPVDMDGWISNFAVAADLFPACIVIADMTIAGGPMVFVNQEFCTTTKYSFAESVGRNCRFLQGAESEPDVILLIRRGLSKGKDCRVKLTNYKKTGEAFQNLLSLKSVYDSDGVYRYVIGAQFEIRNDFDLRRRLVQLDKLLRLLPSKLAFSGGRTSVDSGDHYEVERVENMQENGSHPSAKSSIEIKKNFAKIIYSFTKILWLNNSYEIMRDLISDCDGRGIFESFLTTYSLLQKDFEFLCQFSLIESCKGNAQEQLIKELHSRTPKDAPNYHDLTAKFFDTTNVGIVYDWDLIMTELNDKNKNILLSFSVEILPKFLTSRFGSNLIKIVNMREGNCLLGIKHPLRGITFGVDMNSKTLWLDMFKIVSETCSIGIVVSDMTVPRIPLIHINEGFKAVTGYGKKKIGSNCNFLQGILTEQSINEEIRTALRGHKGLTTKISNYKANGKMFQCLLGLLPVYDIDNELKYQVGLQLDYDATANLSKGLIEFEYLTANIPCLMKSTGSGDENGAYSSDSKLSSIMGGQGRYPHLKMDVYRDPKQKKVAIHQNNKKIKSINKLLEKAKVAKELKYKVNFDIQEETEEDVREEEDEEVVKFSMSDELGFDYDRTNAAFTKIMWLEDPIITIRGILENPELYGHLLDYAKLNCGALTQYHLDFLIAAIEIKKLPYGLKQMEKLRECYMDEKRSVMCVCSNTDIDYANLSGTSWDQMLEDMLIWKKRSEKFLISDFFPRFLDHAMSLELIFAIHSDELLGGSFKCHTAARGLNTIWGPSQTDSISPQLPGQSPMSAKFESVRSKCFNANEDDESGKNKDKSKRNNVSKVITELEMESLKERGGEGEDTAEEEEEFDHFNVLSPDFYYLNMFQAMSEKMSIGLVLSDMTIPGCPLLYVNEGFKAITGYGKEKIGFNIDFLKAQVKSRSRSKDMINEAGDKELDNDEDHSLNVIDCSTNASKFFQCLVAVHNVFSFNSKTNGESEIAEYKYKVGIYIDYDKNGQDLPLKLSEMKRLLGLLPQSVLNDKLPGVDEMIEELEAVCNCMIEVVVQSPTDSTDDETVVSGEEVQIIRDDKVDDMADEIVEKCIIREDVSDASGGSPRESGRGNEISSDEKSSSLRPATSAKDLKSPLPPKNSQRSNVSPRIEKNYTRSSVNE